MFEKEKAYSACDFLRGNLLILINLSSEIAECHNRFRNMEKGCGWLLRRSQEKRKSWG